VILLRFYLGPPQKIKFAQLSAATKLAIGNNADKKWKTRGNTPKNLVTKEKKSSRGETKDEF
jgi:hypothetical protein